MKKLVLLLVLFVTGCSRQATCKCNGVHEANVDDVKVYCQCGKDCNCSKTQE